MIELKGKYGEAKVFTDTVDSESISQVIGLLNQPYSENARIRMMPDVHAGAGCTVGTTMTVGNRICPNLVGVDIGCGMETVKIKESFIEPQALDKLIRREIPSGFSIRAREHRFAKEAELESLICAKHVDIAKARKSIGTLGGGNHFIEADKDEDGNIYIVVHSGSRHLGLEICKHYQKAGFDAIARSKSEADAVIKRLKAEGREQEIQKTLLAMNHTEVHIPRELAYVEGHLMDAYLHDMAIAQKFASLNRQAIVDTIIKGLGLHIAEQFTTVHNYIDIKNMILRKGAVSAQKGEKLLIPINMRDGSLICIGKGNEDWNFSAPHGAGRLMSRSQAKSTFTLSEYKSAMEGIYSTSVGRDTIDECPMAYKPMADIVDNITPTAEIVSVIKPIYNFKAGDE
ncbi:MAG: RtcB family protein [Clostridia bacterium]|nr:RtcB family protein [Clostridia bacterium]